MGNWKHRQCMFIIYFFLTISASTYAQSSFKSLPEDRAKKQTATMKQALELTEEQEKKVAEINLKYARKNENIMAGTGARFSKMSAIKANRSQKNADMNAVLTPEQYQKYLELQEQNAARMKQQRNP